MEINKHIGFTIKEIPELFLYLTTHNITFKELHGCCVLDILESNPHWENISLYVRQGNILCISETIFTKKELNAAQWLKVRSTCVQGYPQPENRFEYGIVTYSSENHCLECGAGLQQKDAFRMKKAPNWGRRHFMMLNWIEDELFVDDSAKSMLESANISGIAFAKVKNKQGTDYLPDVNQLVVKQQLAAGLNSNCRTIDKTHNCPHCGVTKYHASGCGMYEFDKHIFDNAPDIVKTSEVFGWGSTAPRLIIVNQKTYQIITQNHLDRGLKFEPILLV